MFDDLRTHDPSPTEEEKAWMAEGSIERLWRATALALAVTFRRGTPSRHAPAARRLTSS